MSWFFLRRRPAGTERTTKVLRRLFFPFSFGHRPLPLDVVADEPGEMKLEQPFVHALLHNRIVHVRFHFFRDPAQLKAISARDWLEHISRGNTQKLLLELGLHVFDQKLLLPIWIAPLLGNFFHGNPAPLSTKRRFTSPAPLSHLPHFQL